MPYFVEVAFSGVVFFLLSSLATVALETRMRKTPDQKWIAEAQKLSIVPVHK